MAAAAALATFCILFLSVQERPALIEVARLPMLGSVTSVHQGQGGRAYVLSASTGERGWYETRTHRWHRTGGAGWGLEALDDPRGIWSDALSVYVADRNNDRIVRYDRELRPLTEFHTRDTSFAPARFGYPQAVAINDRGDLGILDGESGELVVFDANGRFLFRFGRDPRSGESLAAPVDLTSGKKGEWIILDARYVTTIDMFGTLLVKEAHGLSEPRSVDSDGHLTVLSDRGVLIFRDDTGTVSRFPVGTFNLVNPDAEIRDASLNGDNLYVVLNGELVQFRVEGFQE